MTSWKGGHGQGQPSSAAPSHGGGSVAARNARAGRKDDQQACGLRATRCLGCVGLGPPLPSWRCRWLARRAARGRRRVSSRREPATTAPVSASGDHAVPAAARDVGALCDCSRGPGLLAHPAHLRSQQSPLPACVGELVIREGPVARSLRTGKRFGKAVRRPVVQPWRPVPFGASTEYARSGTPHDSRLWLLTAPKERAYCPVIPEALSSAGRCGRTEAVPNAESGSRPFVAVRRRAVRR